MDGGHCHYAAARIAYKQKKDKLILVTDTLFLGRQKLKFQLNALSAELIDGYFRNSEGNLAGAAISMPQAIKNAIKNLNISIQEGI